jgi:hypothetical protein
VAKTSEPIEKKKPSISIEVRKGDKPKTVKTLNSQFRNHGLAEEPPPPPSRKSIKKPATTTASPLPIIPSISTTFTNSVKSSNISPPPTKKMHIEKALESEVPERAGGVKLIKPKREYTETHFKTFFLFLLYRLHMFVNIECNEWNSRIEQQCCNSKNKCIKEYIRFFQQVLFNKCIV